ncbi:hypothetical protein GCM10027048_19730 [Hymenobacter coalescens]
MKQLSAEEQANYLAVLDKHRKDLLKYDGVTEVAIGYPTQRGILDTSRISILVYVVRKFAQDELEPAQTLPTVLEGVPVDVIQSAPMEHAEELRAPLIGGVGISNVNLQGRGTLGLIVVSRADGQLWGLTNWHVVKRRRGRSNDAIVQPAWKPNNSQYRIGRLLKWNRKLDCAVFAVEHARGSNVCALLDVPGTVVGMAQPLVGMFVTKSGARTGVTYGFVSGVNGINVRIAPNPAKPAANNEISRPGDSGAVWVTDEAAPLAVALHWGGDGENSSSTEQALARDIAAVAAALEFDFQPRSV